eukprot:156547-Chlamydomonas_euryale.AAC.1
MGDAGDDDDSDDDRAAQRLASGVATPAGAGSDVEMAEAALAATPGPPALRSNGGGGVGVGAGAGVVRSQWNQTPRRAGKPSGRDTPPFILGSFAPIGGSSQSAGGAPVVRTAGRSMQDALGQVACASGRMDGAAPPAVAGWPAAGRHEPAGTPPPATPGIATSQAQTGAGPVTGGRLRARTRGRWQPSPDGHHAHGFKSAGGTAAGSGGSAVGGVPAPASAVVDVCVAAPLRWQYWVTTRAVWGAAVGELRLLATLSSLRRHMFAEAGDFAQHLADSLMLAMQGGGAGACARRGARGAAMRLPAVEALSLMLEDAKGVCSHGGVGGDGDADGGNGGGDGIGVRLRVVLTPGRDVFALNGCSGDAGSSGGSDGALCSLRAVASATDAAVLSASVPDHVQELLQVGGCYGCGCVDVWMCGCMGMCEGIKGGLKTMLAEIQTEVGAAGQPVLPGERRQCCGSSGVFAWAPGGISLISPEPAPAPPP